jgi:hypothetical protein
MSSKKGSQAGSRTTGSRYSGTPVELPNKTLHATRNVIGGKGAGEATHPNVNKGTRKTGYVKKGS